MKRPVEERFWAAVKAEPDGCWSWHRNHKFGYGRFSIGAGNSVFAHRFAYQLLIADVPKELDLHHLCHNRGCCNPTHLEPVTRRQHVALSPLSGAPVMRRQKTYCPRGHPYSGDNLYVFPSGARACRTCVRESGERWRQRNLERARAISREYNRRRFGWKPKSSPT